MTRLTTWVAPYTVTAPDAETARRYIVDKAYRDAPDASCDVLALVRALGTRRRWHARVLRIRAEVAE